MSERDFPWGRGWRAALVALGLAIGLSTPAAGTPPPLPPAPADGVHDDAHVFSDEQRARAVKAVAAVRAEGVALYFAAYRAVTGETIGERAERLKRAWCGRQLGMVVVMDASTNQCSFLSHVSETDWISGAQLINIFQGAQAAAEPLPTPPEKFLAVLENLGPPLHEALATHRVLLRPRISPREWRLLGAVGLACLALMAMAGVALKLRRRFQATRPEPAFFPTVEVGQRFGATFGGGVIAEVRFRPAPPSPATADRPSVRKPA